MLLGPRGAQSRMLELQEQIESLSPKPPAPALTNLGGFPGALAGLIGGGNLPLGLGGTDVSPSAGSTQFGGLADAAAQKYGIDPKIFRSLIQVESSWDPTAVSNKGAVGLTQLMPDTAATLGIDDPADPAKNVDGGAKYLKQMLDRFGNDYTKALAAYNAGPTAVERANGIPPYQETIAYVRRILSGARGTASPAALNGLGGIGN